MLGLRSEQRLTTLRLRGDTVLIIRFHSVQKFLTTFRMAHMLDTNVDSFFDVSVTDNLEDDHPNGRWSDIVDNPSASNRKHPLASGDCDNTDFTNGPMIVFVRHAFLLRSVCLDIDDISNVEVN